MSKRQHPLWMPLYVTKFLADTAHLTAHECGVYINMLCAMWKSDDGTLPNDGDVLAKIGRVHPPHWRRTWKAIQSLFDIPGDRLTSTDLQAELGKANAKIVMKRLAASLGGQVTQFKRGTLNIPCKNFKTAHNPLKNNNGAQASAQASAQHNHNKNIKEEEESSGSPRPETGSPSLKEKQATREEVGTNLSARPSPSENPEASALEKALQNWGENFRKRHGGGE
jgi:uncharacterized protein YdaU (DUF1376 family)